MVEAEEREMERQLGEESKNDENGGREQQAWTRKAVIAAVWYFSTINIFLLLVFGLFLFLFLLLFVLNLTLLSTSSRSIFSFTSPKNGI